MITIQYDHLLDGNFARGLSKLSMWGEGSTLTKVVIGKIAKDYSDRAKKVTVDLNETIDSLCEKNEDGTRAAAPNTTGTYVIPDENLDKWHLEVAKPAMTLKYRKLTLDELESVPLLPVEMIALEPILDMPED